MCVSSTLGEWLAYLTWENVSHWTWVIHHLQSICHLYRTHHHQMMAILCLFDLEQEKLRFFAVPARNASAHSTHHLWVSNRRPLGQRLKSLITNFKKNTRDADFIYFTLLWQLGMSNIWSYVSYMRFAICTLYPPPSCLSYHEIGVEIILSHILNDCGSFFVGNI